MSVSSIYFSGLDFLDKGKQIFKHSIIISYIMFFIILFFLSLKSLHKCYLFSKYLSTVFCRKVFIVILLII